MNNLKGKRILIFQQRGWAFSIGHFLAKKLQEENCKLATLTLKKTTHQFILNQKEIDYDLIINNDEVMDDPKKYLQDDDYSLKEICDNLGIDSVWPIIYSLRNHVRSYEDKYYYSYRQSVSDEEIIDYIKAFYKCIKVFFEKFNPEIIIAPNFVSLPHIMFYFYAKKKNIKMLTVTDSKVRGFYLFSYSYNDDESLFINRVNELNKGISQTQNREKAKKYIQEFRNNFKAPDYFKNNENKKSFIKKIKEELSPYKQIWNWYTKKQFNSSKTKKITLDNRPPKIILRDHYCHKKYTKFMNDFDYYPFDKIEKFVYFPLQFQPEATIDVQAPFFSNQIETARQVAMSLPDDYTLLVKEHPAMIGYRTPSYIEKIARTANVKLIDYRISSEKVLKRADLVISPNSTTIVEASFYNKPVIQLGNLGTTLKLPNVFHYNNMTSLSKKIKEVLKIDLKNDEYERRLENYVSAVFDVGFEFDYMGVWERGNEADMEKLWEIYKREIEIILN